MTASQIREPTQAIDRPMFIIGPPRSGTSVLYELLALHPDVGCITRAHKRFPEWPAVAGWINRLGIKSRHPKEASVIWNRSHDTRYDRATADDVTPEARDWYREFVTGVLHTGNRSRFLAKMPALSLRIGWLDAVFPGAIFVVAMRDWRAVTSSTVAKRVKDGRSAFWGVRVPGFEKLHSLPPEDCATAVYREVHESIARDVASLGRPPVTVWYGDLLASPRDEMRRIVESCGLAWTDEFRETVPETIRGRNDKWRQTLSPEAVERIRAANGGALAAYEEPSATV